MNIKPKIDKIESSLFTSSLFILSTIVVLLFLLDFVAQSPVNVQNRKSKDMEQRGAAALSLEEDVLVSHIVLKIRPDGLVRLIQFRTGHSSNPVFIKDPIAHSNRSISIELAGFRYNRQTQLNQ